MNNFDAHTTQERESMLAEIGLENSSQLYNLLPNEIKIDGLKLDKPLSELETVLKIKNMASKNNQNYSSFVGAGAYNRFIPAAVSEISSRFEFNTAYTPYQAEISQGTLQSIYEYQSMICNLTNMDVSNASMYDAATACAEAILMAVRVTGRNKALVCPRINPEYMAVVKTYTDAADIDLSTDLSVITDDIACVLLQTPDYFGAIHDVELLKQKIVDDKTMLICCCDPISLSVLEPPKCDVIVGDLQPLGNSLSFGGPYGGYFACLDKYKRQMPGRIVGRTIDKDNNQAFCLTLQTREQHIRREKATSNICSNQALVALQSTVFMSLMGNEGLRQMALISAQKAHKLASMLKSVGYEIKTKNYLNEFVLKVSNSAMFLSELKSNNILGGVKLDDNRILVCVTEMNTDEEIEDYVSIAKDLFS